MGTERDPECARGPFGVEGAAVVRPRPGASERRRHVGERSLLQGDSCRCRANPIGANISSHRDKRAAGSREPLAEDLYNQRLRYHEAGYVRALLLRLEPNGDVMLA